MSLQIAWDRISGFGGVGVVKPQSPKQPRGYFMEVSEIGESRIHFIKTPDFPR